MPMTVDQIVAEAGHLPTEQVVELVDRLSQRAALIPKMIGYVSPPHDLVSARTVPALAVLVVVAMVAMVPFPPLIDRHDLVLGNWRSERPVPRAAVLKVHAFEERTAEPVD